MTLKVGVRLSVDKNEIPRESGKAKKAVDDLGKTAEKASRKVDKLAKSSARLEKKAKTLSVQEKRLAATQKRWAKEAGSGAKKGDDLSKSLAALTKKYDPLADAQKRATDALKDIDALERANLITKDQSATMAHNVALEYDGVARSARKSGKALSKQSAEFDKSFRASSKLKKGLSGAKVAAGAMAAVLVTKALSGLVSFGVATIDKAARLKVLSNALGASTGFIQEWRFALEQSGGDIAQADNTLERLTEQVGRAGKGVKESAQLFAELGVDVTDASGGLRDIEAIMPLVAEGFAGIEDPAKRARIAQALFGEDTAALIGLLSKGEDGLKNLAKEARRYGFVIEDDLLENAEEINKKFKVLKQTVSTKLENAILQNSAAIFKIAEAAETAANAIGDLVAWFGRVEKYNPFPKIHQIAAEAGYYSSAISPLAAASGTGFYAPGPKPDFSNIYGSSPSKKPDFVEEFDFTSGARGAGGMLSGLALVASSIDLNAVFAYADAQEKRAAAAELVASASRASADATQAEEIALQKITVSMRGLTATTHRRTSATKKQTKESRAVARAERELQSDLAALVRKYDPARAAAERYADELERIARLQNSTNAGGGNLITGEEASLFKRGAFENYMGGVIDDIGENLEEEMVDAGRAGAEEFEDRGLIAAQAIAQIFGGKIGSVLGPILGALLGGQSGNYNSVGGRGGGLLTLVGGGGKGAGSPFGLFGAGFQDGFQDIFKELTGGVKDIFRDVFGDNGLFGKSLGKTLGTAAGGAAIGGAVGKPFTNLIGVRGSSTGSSLGGAAGGLIGGPIGSILGGIAGSILGGLFKKTKTGAAVITSATGAGRTSGKLGGELSGDVDSIQSILRQVADVLGGELGAFNVSIGKRKDYFRVSASGSSRVGDKKYPRRAGGDLLYNGTDERQAILIAAGNAIADGGVTGLSQAVQRALQSDSDIDKALKEALKVRQVEEILGGLGGQLERQFKAFETQAADRLRIARQYGFEVLKIEERNAEDRAALVDGILQSRIGSLQDLLADLTFGDLAEGTLSDQRDKLLTEIARAEKDAAGGKDGAADEVANLRRRLIDLSREAYGTAGGEYAADRESSISSAQRIIDIENERIAKAQAAAEQTNNQLAAGNTLANEGNNLLAQINANLARLGYGGFTGGGGSREFFSTQRQVLK